MKKNNNLRDILFDQMEKLQNCDPEALKEEIQRSKGIGELGKIIIDSSKAEIDFFKALPTERKHTIMIDFLTPGTPTLPAGAIENK